MLFKKLIPLILGVVFWTSLKNNIFNLLEEIKLYNYIDFLGEWGALIILVITFFIFILYKYDLSNAILFIIKILLFPIYLTLNLISPGEISYHYFSKILGGIKGIIYIIFLSLIFWILILILDFNFVYEILFWVLPTISILSLLWLFAWTFDPFNLITGLERNKDKIIKYLNSKVDDLIEKKKKIENNNGDYKDFRRDLDGFYYIIKFLLNFNKMNVLVLTFVIIFLIVTSITIVNFGFSYFALYNLSSEHIRISLEEPNLSNFLLLSFRVSFFSDYDNIILTSNVSVWIAFIQSFNGIFLLTLLILSFSKITTKYVDEEESEFKKILENIYDRLKEMKIDK